MSILGIVYLLERGVGGQFAVDGRRRNAEYVVDDVYDTVRSGQIGPNHGSVNAATLQGQRAVSTAGDHVEEQILARHTGGNLKALIHCTRGQTKTKQNET